MPKQINRRNSLNFVTITHFKILKETSQHIHVLLDLYYYNASATQNLNTEYCLVATVLMGKME
jgi:hypothetical protein